MASKRFVLTSLRVAIYVLIIICSFMISCPLEISLVKHQNTCLLSSRMNVNKQITLLPVSACGYNVATAVLACFIWPLIVIILIILTSARKVNIILTDKTPSLVLAVTDVVALITVLVSACTISVGLKTLCDSFENTLCPGAYVYPEGDHTDPDYFYGTLKTAEVGAWIAFILWLIQLVLNLVMTLTKNRNDRHINIDTETSIGYERIPISP